MLRAEARFREGKELTDEDKVRLPTWRKRLKNQNLVVHYDPDTTEGFFYVPPARRGSPTTWANATHCSPAYSPIPTASSAPAGPPDARRPSQRSLRQGRPVIHGPGCPGTAACQTSSPIRPDLADGYARRPLLNSYFVG